MSKMPTASPSRNSRPLRLAWCLLIGALLLAALVSPAGWNALPDVCLFHRTTGLPCPSCGLTRSWAALVRGQLGLSLRFHALGGVSLLLLLAGLGFQQASGKRLILPKSALVVGALAWVVYGVGRMQGLFPGP